MRSTRNAVLLLVVGLLFGPGAEARKRRRAPARAKVASKQTEKEVTGLLGEFKWGMHANQVIGQIEKEIRTAYKKQIEDEKEPYKQDQLRSERDAAIKKLKKDYVHFEGKSTPWDRSLIDHEFAHKNNESLVVRWGDRDRKFYFFHDGRLWKVYIAFNADLYRNKTFEDFAGVMERRFGPAERKYKMNLKGEAELSHLEWPPAGRTTLIAIDNTDFYGNFCLALIDRKAAAEVRRGRKVNSPKQRYSDPLVEAVTRKEPARRSGTEDIVDRITGKPVKVPPSAGNETGGAPDRPAPPSREKHKSGLDGLDL